MTMGYDYELVSVRYEVYPIDGTAEPLIFSDEDEAREEARKLSDEEGVPYYVDVVIISRKEIFG